MLVNTAIGLLSRRDFLSVKQATPAFTHYDDFDDWYSEREGLQIGLSAAGVETSLVLVEFCVLREWSVTNAMPMSEAALDRLAERAARGSATGTNLSSIVMHDASDLLHARLN